MITAVMPEDFAPTRLLCGVTVAFLPSYPAPPPPVALFRTWLGDRQA